MQKGFALVLILPLVLALVTIFSLPTAGWLSYKSTLTPLRFKYPKDWPVSQCSDPVLFPQMKIEEVVYFDKKCDWMQSQTSIGDVTVEVKNDPNAFVKDFTGPAKIYGYGTSLKSVKIGNKTGYLLVYTPHPTKPPLQTTPKTKTYYIVANNLVYTIRLTGYNFYKGNQAETEKTFEKILTTFQF